MKVLSIAMFLLLGIAACNQKQHTETKMEGQPEATASEMVNVPLSEFAEPKKDWRCGMPLEEGQIADTANYEGKLYGFCSKECKADFVKEPQAYLNQK